MARELNLFIRTGEVYLQPHTRPMGHLFYEDLLQREGAKILAPETLEGVTDLTMSPIARREAYFNWSNPDGSVQRFYVATDGRGRIDLVVTPGHDRTDRFEQDPAWVVLARHALADHGVPRKED